MTMASCRLGSRQEYYKLSLITRNEEAFSSFFVIFASIFNDGPRLLATIFASAQWPRNNESTKMKHLRKGLLALLLLLPGVMWADSYTALWKQYSSAESKDLPKTQLSVLDRITRKAQAAADYGQLLKATLLHAVVQTRVSPDSLAVEVSRLEGMAEEARHKDMVLAAVYGSVLGRIYKENDELPDAQDKSAAWFRQSMQHPALLAGVKAEGYKPLAVQGIDSKIFYDDLLHVIGSEAGDFKTLHDYYQAQGNRAAACLCAFKMVKEGKDGDNTEVKKSRYLQTLDSLMRVYQDLRECGELAIERYRFMEQAEDASTEERYNFINYALLKWGAWPRMNILRNAMAQLTLPSFQANLNGGVALPGRPHDIFITSLNNIQDLTLTVTKTTLDGDTRLNPGDKRDYEKIRKTLAPQPAFTQTHHFYGLPSYKVVSDTMTVKPLPAGVYLVEMTTSNAQIAPERGLLFVSDVYVMGEATGKGRYRLVAVSATTGKPLAGATVRLFTYGDEGKASSVTLTTDENGETEWQAPDRYGFSSLYAFTDTDTSSPRSSFMAHFNQWGGQHDSRPHVQLFTDRKLYRPGQTVHVALIATRNLTDTDEAVAEGENLTIDLRDANYKTVKQQTVTTDAYGTASADFVLPSSGLTGRFSVRASGGMASFRVEEYKRPTFQIEFDTVRVAYHSGDTVRVTGRATTFSGMPVQGARVTYRVRREPSRLWWWRGRDNVSAVTLVNDTIVTDDKGEFVIPVPMTMPGQKREGRQFFNFKAAVQVTDGAGESHEGETSLPLGSRATAFSTTFPDKVERDSLRDITFRYQNAAGQDMAGDVAYRIGQRTGDGTSLTMVGTGTAQANRTVALTDNLLHLPSGRYMLLAQCGADTLSHEFVVFSMDDTQPAANTRDWFYQSADVFPSDGSPVYVQVGSSDDVHIVYSVFANGKEINKGHLDQQDAVKTLRLAYKEAYGDHLLLTCAWMRDGHFYSHSAAIRKPEPDRRLTLRWTTFRDRLVPGQKEEWSLHVERPEGWDGIGLHRAAAPAKAQLLAVLYDKSLDAIAPHSWSFDTHIYTGMTYARWKDRGRIHFNDRLYGELPYKSLVERDLDFTHWDDACFLTQAFDEISYGALNGRIGSLGGQRKLMAMARAESVETASGTYDAASTADSGMELAEVVATKKDEGDKSPTAQSPVPSLRENLDETAFFYPNLETDEKGDIKLKFTLPESVTTWKFMGLAHDKDVNFGMLGGEAVAQKTVMVQPNMPRFVRMGDEAQVTSRIMNHSEKAVSGRATLQLVDPETQKTVYATSCKYKIEALQTANVTMTVPTEGLDGSLYIVRVMAEGRGYSDGEQHYLPVLPDVEPVTNTIPFTQNGPGTKTIDLAALADGNKARFTVEYTNNPAWLMVQALPYVTKTYDDNAISLAAAYYANALGKAILASVPNIKTVIAQWKASSEEGMTGDPLQSALEKNQELKNIVLDETPWVGEAETETEQKQMLVRFFDDNTLAQRQRDVFSKLQKLQRTDGSFSWWPGMPGSVWMTEAVAKMLVRLNVMTGGQSQTADILNRAYGFLQKETAREVAAMRKEEKEGAKDLVPSNAACDFLYISAMSGRKATDDIRYLLSRLERQPARLTIYGKAMSAIILARYGKTQRADECLQSVNEYTVYKEEMGRWFDTPKAQYSWFDYRIPSQVAAIEAIKALTPDDTVRLEEMQRWLLQEKRTQMWTTPINTVDAVYAFFGDKDSGLSTSSKLSSGAHATLRIDGKPLEMPQATAGLGYVKATVDGSFKTFTASKTSGGTSWGAVYAQFRQKTDSIGAASAGLKVTRAVVGGTRNLQVGDKVRVRITIEADRDYDFVQVSDKRAACMEPVNQLSGYRQGYYLAPKDNVTNYYFDRMRKGKHVVETEYYIDREGSYQTGTCTVQCAYSPEFGARDAAMKLEVGSEEAMK